MQGVDKFADRSRGDEQGQQLNNDVGTLLAEVWQQSVGMTPSANRCDSTVTHDMVLCGTHEETVTYLVAGEVKSYNSYHFISIKFRLSSATKSSAVRSMRGRELL